MTLTIPTLIVASATIPAPVASTAYKVENSDNIVASDTQFTAWYEYLTIRPTEPTFKSAVDSRFMITATVYFVHCQAELGLSTWEISQELMYNQMISPSDFAFVDYNEAVLFAKHRAWLLAKKVERESAF